MFIIGLTGGIACGKSAISLELQKLGATALDIDEITYELLLPFGELFDVYVQHFGSYVVGSDGFLNKKLVGEIIFNHPDEREWINSVAHPILLNNVRDFLEQCQAEGHELVIIEVPLLFEVGWEFLFDEIWAVHVKPSQQIWRLMQRDNLSYRQAQTRIAVQMPINEICRRADVVINNTKNRTAIRQQVRAALKGRYLGGSARG